MFDGFDWRRSEVFGLRLQAMVMLQKRIITVLILEDALKVYGESFGEEDKDFLLANRREALIDVATYANLFIQADEAGQA